MTDTTITNSLASEPEILTSPIVSIEEGQARVGQLLAGLQESAPSFDGSAAFGEDVRFENHLAVVRLGMATSLFYALRTKHAPTACHCLRVALSCSAWAERLGLDAVSRDRIEVAALLHDLGKIGIPDRILRKPGKLSVDEQLTMDLTSQLGCEILRGCTTDQELLEIVLYATNWYDSRRNGDAPRGDALPIGSRMLAIADAFDAMTTDTVYRPAMSRERAIQELMGGACTQFDPELAADFSRMLESRPEMLQGVVVNRWLRQLEPGSDQQLWGASIAPAQPATLTVRRETLFYQQLIGHMQDGVAFTDAEGTITGWNGVMEQLTSIAASAIVGQSWSGESLRLREKDSTRDNDACLVKECLSSGVSVSRSMMIEQPGREPASVHVQVSPVTGPTPGIHGVVVIVRDLSDQKTLQERLESLHQQTTRDALTGISNRAHFDEMLNELAAQTAAGGPTFSLVICDIDHFKRVNDVHGHPAGDEALIRFAGVLSDHSRDGDIVARYGGEEFCLLTPNCDNGSAAKRAEAIRRALENTPLPSLGGEFVTASFGVTEFQSGDTGETVLTRADRALLKAKDNGRNRVIQLGAGNRIENCGQEPEAKRGWFGWFHGPDPAGDGEFDIVTPVPVDLAIEKLRGFIADHNAEIISVKENHVSLKLNAIYSHGGRRRVDQQMAIRATLTLSELRQQADGRWTASKTNVHVRLHPIRNRDRRGREVSECFKQVVKSLKSYLMGELQSSDLG